MPKATKKVVTKKVVKTASKPEIKPKLVFKKGTTSPIDVLVYAADNEGMWCRDVIKFSDLRSKYNLPNLPESIVTKAHLKSRERVRDLYAKYNKPVGTKVPEDKPVGVVKKTLPTKKVAPAALLPSTKSVVKKVAVKVTKKKPNVGISLLPTAPTKKVKVSAPKTIGVFKPKTLQKRN